MSGSTKEPLHKPVQAAFRPRGRNRSRHRYRPFHAVFSAHAAARFRCRFRPRSGCVVFTQLFACWTRNVAAQPFALRRPRLFNGRLEGRLRGSPVPAKRGRMGFWVYLLRCADQGAGRLGRGIAHGTATHIFSVAATRRVRRPSRRPRKRARPPQAERVQTPTSSSMWLLVGSWALQAGAFAGRASQGERYSERQRPCPAGQSLGHAQIRLRRHLCRGSLTPQPSRQSQALPGGDRDAGSVVV
jgi:hypothetical protein